jgi:hypothetical protein
LEREPFRRATRVAGHVRRNSARSADAIWLGHSIGVKYLALWKDGEGGRNYSSARSVANTSVVNVPS